MSGEYVRSATSRQERDTSGECWRCANKDKRIAELEAQVAALKQLADPLTKALYDEMSKRHTEVCKENARIRAANDEADKILADGVRELQAQVVAQNKEIKVVHTLMKGLTGKLAALIQESE